MADVGIAGFQLAYVGAGGGQTVEEPMFFGDAEWYEAVRHAAAEADRLDTLAGLIVGRLAGGSTKLRRG